MNLYLPSDVIPLATTTLVALKPAQNVIKSPKNRRAGGFTAGPGLRLLAVALVWLSVAQLVAEGPRVKWGGVMFRGKAVDRPKLYPMLSEAKTLEKLQEVLTGIARGINRTDCQIMVDGQFSFTAGDGLVMGCVIEDEDFIEAKLAFKDRNEYYGQLVVAASIIVFDFQQGVVVSSAIVSTMVPFGDKDSIKEPLSPEQRARLLEEAVYKSQQENGDLISRVKTKMGYIPIKQKANFGRLQVNLPTIEEASVKELEAEDPLQSIRIRRQFSQKIAASLVEDFRINVLPPIDGDSTLSQMTVSFADKSKLSANEPAEKVFQLPPPTVVAEISISNVGNEVVKKYSNNVQTTMVFGAGMIIKFIELGNLKYEKLWGYGANRGFPPETAESQAASVKRLMYRKAIEDGFENEFMKTVVKDKKWKQLTVKLSM